MNRILRIAAPAAAVALAIGLGACVNPFRPATPEAPVGVGVVENFSTPDALIQTMADAIQARGVGGRNAYIDALADSTSPETPAYYAFAFPGVLDAWRLSGHTPTDPLDLTLEKRFYDYLAGYLANFSYSWAWKPDNDSPSDQIDNNAGTALYHRKYVLAAASTGSAIVDTFAVGYADLYMQKLNGRWFLYRWEDRVDPVYGVNPSNAERRSMGWRRLESTTTP